MALSSLERSILLYEVLEVLAYAEGQNVLHGDIHFGNVLLGDNVIDVTTLADGKLEVNTSVEVIDFGTSMLAGKDSSAARHARLLRKFAYDLLPEFEEWFKPTTRLARRTGREMLPPLRAALTIFLSVLSDGPPVTIRGLPDPPRRVEPGPTLVATYLIGLADFDLSLLFRRLWNRYNENDMRLLKHAAILQLGPSEIADGHSEQEIDAILIRLLVDRGMFMDDAAARLAISPEPAGG